MRITKDITSMLEPRPSIWSRIRSFFAMGVLLAQKNHTIAMQLVTIRNLNKIIQGQEAANQYLTTQLRKEIDARTNTESAAADLRTVLVMVYGIIASVMRSFQPEDNWAPSVRNRIKALNSALEHMNHELTTWVVGMVPPFTEHSDCSKEIATRTDLLMDRIMRHYQDSLNNGHSAADYEEGFRRIVSQTIAPVILLRDFYRDGFNECNLDVLLPLAAKYPQFAGMKPSEGIAYVLKRIDELERFNTRIKNDHGIVQIHYQELIHAVESKWPNETRHQTALRHIRSAETMTRDAQKAVARGMVEAH